MPLVLKSDPAFTIAGALEAIRAGRLSCREMLGRCLDRIAAAEPAVRAWVVVDEAGARAQAAALDAELAAGRPPRPLHGIPVGVKDIIDVRGLPTGRGAPGAPGGPAAADAPVVARLRAAGAVLVGKTVTTPHAWIDPPPTRNPHDPGRTPGGSSSGSAAALACGMVLGALGSQTGGSITRPAAYCGVCGLKPTFGALPAEGVAPLAPSLDHPGVLARTVADLAPLWAALAGAPSASGPPEAPPRLGWLRGAFEEEADPPMRAALEVAAIRLRAAGIAVFEREPPFDLADVLRRHRTVMAAEAAMVHRDDCAAAPGRYRPRIAALIAEGQAIPGPTYGRARREQTALLLAAPGWFDDLDALWTPAAPGPAPNPETTGWDPLESTCRHASLSIL